MFRKYAWTSAVLWKLSAVNCSYNQFIFFYIYIYIYFFFSVKGSSCGPLLSCLELSATSGTRGSGGPPLIKSMSQGTNSAPRVCGVSRATLLLEQGLKEVHCSCGGDTKTKPPRLFTWSSVLKRPLWSRQVYIAFNWLLQFRLRWTSEPGNVCPISLLSHSPERPEAGSGNAWAFLVLNKYGRQA